MKKRLKKQWIKALRSGEYKQGQHRLRSSKDEFCCLGVLCDIGLNTDWVETSGDNGNWGIRCRETFGIPSDLDLHALGLPSQAAWDLACLNDVGCPFSEIADWIEENL